MMKKLVVSMFLILSQMSMCYAIDYFESGHIITLQHDTIKGFIEILGESQIRTKICFKNATNDVVFYAPTDIAGFILETGESFSSVTYNYAKNGAKYTEQNFAKILLKADISLFKIQLSTAAEDYVYVISKEGQFHTILPDQDSQGIYTGLISNKSIGILIYILNPCSDIEYNQIISTKFKDANMVALLSTYRTCVLPELQQQLFPDKSHMMFKPILNIGYTFLQVSDKEYWDSTLSLPGICIGAFVEISNPRLSKKQAFVCGISYLSRFNNDVIDWGLKVPIYSYSRLYKKKDSSVDLILGMNVSYHHLGLTLLNLEAGFSYRYNHVGFSSTFEQDIFMQAFSCYANMAWYF